MVVVRQDREICTIPPAPLCFSCVPTHGRKAVAAAVVCVEISKHFVFLMLKVASEIRLMISDSKSPLQNRFLECHLSLKVRKSLNWKLKDKGCLRDVGD